MVKSTKISEKEVQQIIVRLNLASNEIFDAMNVAQNTDRYLWMKIYKICNEVDRLTNQLNKINNV